MTGVITNNYRIFASRFTRHTLFDPFEPLEERTRRCCSRSTFCRNFYGITPTVGTRYPPHRPDGRNSTSGVIIRRLLVARWPSYYDTASIYISSLAHFRCGFFSIVPPNASISLATYPASCRRLEDQNTVIPNRQQGNNSSNVESKQDSTRRKWPKLRK